MARQTLGARIAWAVFLYAIALSGVVLWHGYTFNESAEEAVWETMLGYELDRLVSEGTEAGPLSNSEGAMRLYRSGDALPPPLRGVRPGVHDEVDLGDHTAVVLVKRIGEQTYYLALDIDRLEREEARRAQLLTIPSAAAALMLVAGAWFVSRRLQRPLSRLAESFRSLRPDQLSRRLEIPAGATAEEAVIAGAMNEYLERQENFVRREREFIDSVSHELRTPVAVIAGAAEVIASHPHLGASLSVPTARIRQTAEGMEQMIDLLLVLARDPRRLAESCTPTDLGNLLPRIVTDHLHLAEGKSLSVIVGRLERAVVLAPTQVLEVAIGNLLRNAIENSDSGVITVEMNEPGLVRISDPGHGMSASEIAEFYASLARRGVGRVGEGVGLELIARLCNHLGWTLRLEPGAQGTVAELDLRSALQVG